MISHSLIVIIQSISVSEAFVESAQLNNPEEVIIIDSESKTFDTKLRFVRFNIGGDYHVSDIYEGTKNQTHHLEYDIYLIFTCLFMPHFAPDLS